MLQTCCCLPLRILACYLSEQLRFLVRQDVRIKATMNSEMTTLFHQESNNRVTYRIPALLYIPTDTFLAFAEKRSSPRDEDAEHLVLRRGQKKGASVEWGCMETLTNAVLPGHRTMSPCPVYEREKNRVFLFFNCVKNGISESHQIKTGQNTARLCHIFSEDGGHTWSLPTDLTDTVIGEDLRHWATFAVGPGHGVQLNSGRLVIPAYIYHITVPSSAQQSKCETQACSLIFYSDDSGATWHKGELIQDTETEKREASESMKINTLECQVAEVTGQNGDTLLYCNARTKNKFRVEAFSRDQGLTFTICSLCNQLHESRGGCQGSVVSFTPTEGHGKDSSSRLLFSHPKDKTKRKDLGIYLNASPLEAKWECPWILHKGPSGYSDLAVCKGPPLFFGCLFECGKDHSYEKIAFCLFTQENFQNKIGSSQSHSAACQSNTKPCCLI